MISVCMATYNGAKYIKRQLESILIQLKKDDEVIIYEDVDTIVQKVDFDVFAVGGDQIHSGFQRAVKWCEEHGKEVIRLSRTPGIASSQIKKELRS